MEPPDTPEGIPLSYEVLAGNTADSTTLGDLLTRIETRYGKANRIWCMDGGVLTEAILAQMRAMGASYLVGTPKGRLTRCNRHSEPGVDQPIGDECLQYGRPGLLALVSF